MPKSVAKVKTKGRLSAGLRADRQRSRFASPLDKATTVEVAWEQVAGIFNAARGLEQAEFVYVVGEGGEDGPIKIGLSAEPIERLRGMQTGNSRPLRIEYVLLGNRRLEGFLHSIWEPHAITSPRREGKAPAAPGTEWFQAAARESFLPAARLAVEKQLALLEGEPALSELCAAVIEAHVELGIDIASDKPRLLRR